MSNAITDDAKSALTLSGAFAVSAVASVPLLLPVLPREARELPLPLPVFCAILAVQLTVVYGLLALGGIRLARHRGLEPTPFLQSAWTKEARKSSPHSIAIAALAGLACGLCLVVAVAMIQALLPGTLPSALHPPGIAAAMLASTAGSLGEEILFRLFLLSVLLRVLPACRMPSFAIAVAASACAFGAAHAPAFVFLFGGIREVPPMAWVWLIALNGQCGVTYGIVYLHFGIEAAIIAHLATDTVWHVATQFFA